MITKRWAQTALAGLVSVTLAACGGGSGASPPAASAGPVAVSNQAVLTPALTPSEYQPPAASGDGWAVAAAEMEGFDEASLDTMLGDIRDGFWRNIDGIAIARRGTLVLDRTLRTTLAANDAVAGNQNPALHRVYSVTKSVTATLVGIAIDQGVLAGVDTPL